MMRATLLISLLAGCLMAPRQGTQPSSTSSDPAPTTSSSSSMTPTSTAPDRAATPPGPQTVSVTIRSACSKTAKVFYGEKPGFSSGTSSSVSSNEVSSKTFRVGDQMWVTDDSGKGLGNVQIQASTRNIEIASSCAGLSAR